MDLITPHKDSSVRCQQGGIQRAPGGEHRLPGEVTHPPPRGQRLLDSGPPPLAPPSLPLAPWQTQGLLSSVATLADQWNPRRGLWEPLICGPGRQRLQGACGPAAAAGIKVGGTVAPRGLSR